MDGTIITQGSFTATGLNINLAIPSNTDWMAVYNYTAAGTNTVGVGQSLNAQFYWQRGMAIGTGLATQKLNAANNPLTINALASPNGFTLLNQSQETFGIPTPTPLLSVPVAESAVSNSTSPVVTTSSIAASGVPLQNGSVIRLSQTPASPVDNPALLGTDFQVNFTDDTHFTFATVLANTVGASVNAGSWRLVNISSMFYPQFRYIVNIATTGAFGTLTASVNSPVVVTSVAHGYQLGQIVRFNVVSAVNGMTQINQMTATITGLDMTNPNPNLFAFQVSLNTAGFTPFVFPTNATLLANNNYTPAIVDLLGQDTAFSLANNVNTLSDASFNQAIIGMTLGGANGTAQRSAGPAGAVGDVMYWVAGKSYLVNNM